MRILVRISGWAIWARRLGSFALPLTVIPILMLRAQYIDGDSFAAVELVALAVSALALLVSLGAFSRIWSTGDIGWGHAIAGLLLSVVCLLPAAYWGYEAFRYPSVMAVSTDNTTPPPLVSATAIAPPSAGEMQRLASVFPKIRTRSYPLRVTQAFDIVDKLVTERGWEVRLRQVPVTTLDNGQINAIATNLFGFRDEVSIRLAATAGGTSVDMRAASQSPLHEPGIDGRRIEEFLTALDARVTLMMRDQPAGTLGDDADAEPDSAAVAPTPAPAPRGRKR